MENIPINLMDAAWLYVEKKAAPAHFGPLVFMSCPEGEPDFVKKLVAQWRQHRDFAPPFNYRLANSLVPRWEVVADEDLDMEYHFRHSALPEPGGEQELGVLVSRLHSYALDRAKPLWQCYLIEGLESGQFALYIKLHHAQLDGMAAANLMARCFTLDPGKSGMPPPWSIGLKGERNKTSVPKTFSPVKIGKHKLGQGNSLVKALSSLTRNAYMKKNNVLSAPYQGPKSALNSRISPHRRFATQRFELADLKRVATAGGVKVNAVFIAIIGAALRRYLQEFSDLPAQSLVGQVPVSIRPADDASAGNALSFVYVSLGTNIDDPVERLQVVHESSESSKMLQSQLTKDVLEAYTAVVLAPYITETILNLGGHYRPSANLVISNVAGPRERLYFNGARVEHIYGPSVLFHGQALNITLASYADEVNISFTACRDTLPSMQKIAVYSYEEFERLAAALGCTLLTDERKT